MLAASIFPGGGGNVTAETVTVTVVPVPGFEESSGTAPPIVLHAVAVEMLTRLVIAYRSVYPVGILPVAVARTELVPTTNIGA